MSSPPTQTQPSRAHSRIEIVGLTKSFGSFKAVDNLTFSVEPGRITGFLGPNGAGKTTTLRMVLGLITPTAGHSTIGGVPYAHLKHPTRTVGAALEATNFHPGRSGRDHLRVLAAAGGIPESRVDEMLELVGIPAAAKRRAGNYSMGMRQRLGLAAAMLGDPNVLVLDEPTNGLDPEGIRWLRGFLRHLAGEKKTILISSHLLGEVQATVDDVVIISNGRLVKNGPIESLHGQASAIVRTTDPARLASALHASGITSERLEDTVLQAYTSDLQAIGDTALSAGLPIYELRAQQQDLEALFFELTSQPENQNRNLAGAEPPPPVGQHLPPHRGQAPQQGQEGIS
ncbi:ABC transporter ATP-binding protein [Leekyejoonella antrihumi]|uniref:ABC transporter ATP-binding protein n=1 Tax=Leekyejoonella antrihumi TaxID=1660198 RepID=UPI001FECDD27|nr:ATP-binding cassette domain-containing protein [Leekyejoonella antrihumi]